MNAEPVQVKDTALNVAIVLLLSEWAKQEKENHYHMGKLRLLIRNLAARFREEIEVEALEESEQAAVESSKGRIITLD